MTTTLSDKITSAEQFDATPAGKALKAFRRALQKAEHADCNPHLGQSHEAAPRTGELWTKRRAAEYVLIEEIKALQAWADLAKQSK